MQAKRKAPLYGAIASGLIAAGAGVTNAEPTYSIDFQGPVVGVPDPVFGILISEGEILTSFPAPFSPAPPMIDSSAAMG